MKWLNELSMRNFKRESKERNIKINTKKQAKKVTPESRGLLI